MNRSYVTRDFARLANKFYLEEEVDNVTSGDEMRESMDDEMKDSLEDEQHEMKSLEFRRSGETDQSKIIVDDINAVSDLLNKDLNDDEFRNAWKDNLESGTHNDEVHPSSRHSGSFDDEPWALNEPLLDHDQFEEQVYTLSDSKPFTAYLNKMFDESTSRTLRLLKGIDQAYVVCVLGHLGVHLFHNYQMRFKDIRPSTWKVIIRKYHDTYSIVHRRTERALKFMSNFKLEELFSFEWEVEMVFDSKQLNYIDQVHMRLIDIRDHTDLCESDHEENLRKAFEGTSIRDCNFHLQPSKEESKKTVDQASPATHQQHRKWSSLLSCISK